ncbi:hypothetical protein ACPF04_05980 [Campylobacter sp. MOP51]|uniref:hypothetical protein n=1 Tax=Campylobacter canis TaxID=3378588 RepID=UPI00387EA3F7
MKTKGLIFISIATAVILIGCGGNDTKSKPTNVVEQTKVPIDVTEVKPMPSEAEQKQMQLMHEMAQSQDEALESLRNVKAKEIDFSEIFGELNTTTSDTNSTMPQDGNTTHIKTSKNFDIFAELKAGDDVYNTKGVKVDPLTGAPLEDVNLTETSVQVMEFDQDGKPIIRSIEESRQILNTLKQKDGENESNRSQ